MMGIVIKHEENVLICVFSEKILQTSKTKSDLNSVSRIVRVLPGEIYDSDNFESGIRRYMHKIEFLRNNSSILRSQSFEFAVGNFFSCAHVLFAL
jgi:hypothetical protein